MVSADANVDGFVSLAEAFAYAKDKGLPGVSTSSQEPQSYNSNCVFDCFTSLNGGIFPVPVVRIRMGCCPPMPPYAWEPIDCAGLGIEIQATTTMPGPERALAEGGLQTTAKLENAGTASSPAGSLSYYYRAPTLGLGFYDTGWQAVGTQTIPPLGPGDSLTLPPVAFHVPDVNPFGEPFWTVAARIQEPSTPAGSGWLADDRQVKMVNAWTLTALPEEPREIHFQVVNPSSDTTMVVLGVDRSGYPPEWLYQLSPPANDTMRFLPHEVRVATLTLQAAGTGSLAGTLDVSESLLPSHGYGACADTACSDSTCGGFIRVTGGCAVTLVSQSPTATLVSLVSAQADPDRVRLAWFCSGAVGQGVTIYRRTVDSGWQALGSLTADGTGRISFEDPAVVAGGRYGYRLGVRVGSSESYQGETWIEVPRRFALALQGLRPNPTQRDIAVLFSLPDMAPATLELLDVSGRRVVRREVGSLGPGNHVLNLGRETAIPAGVYLVRLFHGSQLLLAKGTVLR